MTNAQSATVNLSGDAAEVIRKVMRQTGWNVDQSLAYIFGEADHEIEQNGVSYGKLAVEGNTVGIQVISNSITAHQMEVGDPIRIDYVIDEFEPNDTIELFGVVNGFAPQGVGVTLTDRSINTAKSYDVKVNKDDIWSPESIKAL